MTTEEERGVWNVPVTCAHLQPQPYSPVDSGVPAGPLLLTGSCSTMALTSSVPALLPTPRHSSRGLLAGSWQEQSELCNCSLPLLDRDCPVFVVYFNVILPDLRSDPEPGPRQPPLRPGSPLCAIPSCLGPLRAPELTRAAFMCCSEGSHSNLNC